MISIKGILKLTIDMVEVFRPGQMVLGMRDTGRMIRQILEVNLFMLMGIFMMVIVLFFKAQVNGLMIKLMVMEPIPILMELSMRDIGKKTNKTDQVKKLGLMVHVIKEITNKDVNQDMVNLNGLMVLNMKANFQIIIYTAKVR